MHPLRTDSPLSAVWSGTGALGQGVHIFGREKYRDEYRKINEFLQQNKNGRILFLELGVGRMTPMFIQEPFWNLTYQLPQAYYITINPKDALLPKQLAQKGRAIKEDIADILREAVERKKKQEG